MPTVTIDKAFLKYYDEHGFGKKSAEEVRIAKLAFVAGYEAAEHSMHPTAFGVSEAKPLEENGGG